MRMLGFSLIAIGACSTIALAGVISLDRTDLSRWSLVVETDSGDQFVVDHALTSEDCATRSKSFLSYPVVWCEREKVAARG